MKEKMKSTKSIKHHWIGLKPNPKKYFGFVYLITNLVNGKMYIGKKQYHVYKKRKIARQSDWHYTSQAVSMLKKILKHTEKNPSSLEYLNIIKQEGDSSMVKLIYNTNVMYL